MDSEEFVNKNEIIKQNKPKVDLDEDFVESQSEIFSPFSPFKIKQIRETIKKTKHLPLNQDVSTLMDSLKETNEASLLKEEAIVSSIMQSIQNDTRHEISEKIKSLNAVESMVQCKI